MKKKKLFPAVVYTHMQVHYDDEGTVHLISNIEDPTKKNFSIELELVEDFLLGRKNFRKFKIDYFFNLSKGIVTSEEQTIINKGQVLYLIPRTSEYNNEITLEKNAVGWRVIVHENAKDRLDILSTVSFFVVKKDDPYYLYRHFSVDPKVLGIKPIEIPFAVEQEQGAVSVATLQQFNSYGIIKV
jgi:hypothetical protein